MINILNSSLELQAIIKNIVKPWRFERINDENIFTFTAVLDTKAATYINENNIVEFENDYFNIAYYSKNINEDGTATIQVECEHVSYELNDSAYDTDNFAYTGTPTEVLTDILAGTDFTVGTIEFTESITYSAQEKKSRRQMLMEFVSLLGGEVVFNKYEVSILARRGSTDLQILTTGKNIKIISKIYNGRENPATVAYTCTPIQLPDKEIAIGDDVLLIQSDLGIEDTLRVVSIGYNPDDETETEIEISNAVKSLEDQIYRIQTTTVAKEKVYNGCKIGPEEGFVATKSDNTVKSVLNATDGISIQLSDDNGNTWEAVFYVTVVEGVPKLYLGGPAVFTGSVTGATIKTAQTGARIEITNAGIKSFNASNELHGIVFDPAAADADFKLCRNGDEYFKVKHYLDGIALLAYGNYLLRYITEDNEIWPIGNWYCGFANFQDLTDGESLYATRKWVEDNFQPL